MIRKNIIKNKNDKQRYFLNDSWRIEMPAVVRTPFYGNNCSEYFGYVVTYSEMEQAYHLLKVDLHNGKILWSIDAVNGGYGTPTVFGDLVVFLKEFDAVQAVSAESGIVEWAVQGGHRVRTTLNVIDETLWFGSGSTLLAVNKNGEVVKKLHIPNSFIYGNITPYKGGILCTGTLHNNERDCSCSYLCPSPAALGGFLFFRHFHCKPSPGAEMLRGGKNGHIHANLRDDANSGKGLDT